MPLPFARPPKDSALYQQLESTTLETLTADQLDTIKAKTFSQGTDGNEDEYRRLLLLGLASDKLSSAGPIPETGVIKTVTATSDSTETVFRPSAGEVFQLTSADATAIGGTVRFKFQMYDGSSTIEIIDQSITSSTTPIDITTVPLIIDNNVYLRVNISGISGGESGSVNVSFIRTR